VSLLNLQKAIENEMARLAPMQSRSAIAPGDQIAFGRPDLEARVSLHGFGPPEEGGRWAIGSRAGFVFDLASAPHAVMEMDVRAFVTATEGRTMRMQCGDGPVHEFRFTAGAETFVTIAIPIEHRNSSAALRTRLWLSDLTGEGQPGPRQDRRALGVFVRCLRVKALDPLLVEQRVALGAEDGRSLALSCFGQAEARGRWTVGETCALICRPSGESGGVFRMFVELTPLVTRTHAQVLRVRNDAEVEFEFRFPEGRQRKTAVSFPVAQRSDNALSQIQFNLRNARSPQALGLGGDSRALGVQVHAIRIARQTRWAAWKDFWNHRAKPAASSEKESLP